MTTDDGSARDSRRFAGACARHGVRRERTRPYAPGTDGEVERFTLSSVRERAYAAPFASPAERAAAPRPWLHGRDAERPRPALGGKPPVCRPPEGDVLGKDG